MDKFRAKETVIFDAPTTGLEGKILKATITLLDKNKTALAAPEELDVPVINGVASCEFTVETIAKNKSVELSEVKYVEGWLDANGDGEVNLEYDKSIMFELVKECCELNVDAFIEMLYFLRKKQGYKTYKESFFDKKREEQIISITSDKDEKLTEIKDKINLFVNEMNKMFEKYKVNTCNRKIHFLAQMYQETYTFRATEETLYNNRFCNNYLGGCSFRGRGMKQLTHDYNYLGYYDYVNNTNYYDIYNKLRKERTISVENVLNEKTILNRNFYNNILKPFSKKLSTELFFAFDSAGWFSTMDLPGENRKKLLLDAMDNGLNPDDVTKVTKIINGGEMGLSNRIDYTNWIKEYFGVE